MGNVHHTAIHFRARCRLDLKRRPQRSLWDQTVSHINPDAFFVLPSLVALGVAVEIRGVLLARRRTLELAVIRPELVPTTIPPSLPSLAGQDG